MKEFCGIILCMFAVYGVFRFLTGLGAAWRAKGRTVIAIRVSDGESRDALSRRIAGGAAMASDAPDTESTPVLLCENGAEAEAVLWSGCACYVRVSGASDMKVPPDTKNKEAQDTDI